MKAEQIERINELSRIARTRPLTQSEQDERQALRAEYLAGFRQSFRAQLDNTKVEYPDGTRVPLRDAPKDQAELNH